MRHYLSLLSHIANVSYVKYESGETKEEIVSYLQHILSLENEVHYLICSITLLNKEHVALWRGPCSTQRERDRLQN
jgi:hypothetical protein